jgi:hypothetical protein
MKWTIVIAEQVVRFDDGTTERYRCRLLQNDNLQSTCGGFESFSDMMLYIDGMRAVLPSREVEIKNDEEHPVEDWDDDDDTLVDAPAFDDYREDFHSDG